MQATQTATSTKKNWAGIVISAIPVLLFTMGVVMALTRNPEAVQGFKHSGYPDSAFMPLAIVELACAVLYVIPRTSMLGAIVTTGYLGGAVATHLRVGDPLVSHTLFPIYVGALLWAGLYLRDARVRRLLAPR
jgi:hypothetical protein